MVNLDPEPTNAPVCATRLTKVFGWLFPKPKPPTTLEMHLNWGILIICAVFAFILLIGMLGVGLRMLGGHPYDNAMGSILGSSIVGLIPLLILMILYGLTIKRYTTRISAPAEQKQFRRETWLTLIVILFILMHASLWILDAPFPSFRGGWHGWDPIVSIPTTAIWNTVGLIVAGVVLERLFRSSR